MVSSLRKCEIMQRLEYLPDYPDWRPTLHKNLAENDMFFNGWAFIVHDKDHNEMGEVTEPHIHLICDFKMSLKITTIANFFGVETQYVSPIKQKKRCGSKYYADIGGGLSYLTHRNALDKHQYDDTEVVAMEGYDWITERTKSENLRTEIKNLEKTLTDIENGIVKRYNLADNITQSMYIRYKTEFDRAFEFYTAKVKKQNDRNIDVLFVTGDSGSGKTTLAKNICTEKGYSYCVSGSSRDPFQEYSGQEAIILDDLRPEFFSLSDLLKIIDNNTASAVGARYKDKWIEAKLIIITSILTIDMFFMNLRDNVGEPIEQFKRRAKIMIECNTDKYDMYTYKSDKKDYDFVSTHANTITTQFKNKCDYTSEQLTEFGNLLEAKIRKEHNNE